MNEIDATALPMSVCVLGRLIFLLGVVLWVLFDFCHNSFILLSLCVINHFEIASTKFRHMAH